MTDTLTNPPQGEESSLIQACRSQNQVWTTAIVQYEQEIDNLLALLADLLEHPTYQNLRLRAIDYYGTLNQVKSRFQRLRLDMVCENRVCMPSDQQVCREPRFGLYTLVDSHLRALADEFSRVKAGCYQFLSVMVTLNML
ncbi:hypothetical protein WBJ53_03455 [Spirosoma sp. SC4-14]|uniref:hypothetical protein n=1 Tax=Spirosoma sp. SC4-14 TaxID=3128900 RepID=UPI0030D354D9